VPVKGKGVQKMMRTVAKTVEVIPKNLLSTAVKLSPMQSSFTGRFSVTEAIRSFFIWPEVIGSGTSIPFVWFFLLLQYKSFIDFLTRNGELSFYLRARLQAGHPSYF